MPALGAGHALLKWVTSFPGNPARGLPTVTGLALLSNAADGSLRAALDAGAVTALRTGAAAVLAAEELGREDAETAAVIGVGVNGRAAAKTFLARGREVMLWDVDKERARTVADELGARVAESRQEALAADLLVTVTPGHEILLEEGSLRPGQHVQLLSARLAWVRETRWIRPRRAGPSRETSSRGRVDASRRPQKRVALHTEGDSRPQVSARSQTTTRPQWPRTADCQNSRRLLKGTREDRSSWHLGAAVGACA
jgi:hypothetical protein